MGEANFDSESIVTITGNELTLVIITSIHTLKRNKKKCGRQEVYNLVKESVEFEISSEVFTEIISYLIEKKISYRQYISKSHITTKRKFSGNSN